jgi:hypothetical protein
MDEGRLSSVPEQTDLYGSGTHGGGVLRLWGYVGVAAVTVGATLFGAAAGAVAGDPKKAVQAAADEPTSIVETFDYPGAEQISADRDILLKKGDGHLLLTDCVTGADLIQVRSRNRDPFCFRLTAPTGWLTLELSDAFLVFSDSKHTTVADYTVDGVSDSTTVAPGGAEGIGEGSGTTGHPAVLLKLSVG